MSKRLLTYFQHKHFIKRKFNLTCPFWSNNRLWCNPHATCITGDSNGKFNSAGGRQDTFVLSLSTSQATCSLTKIF